MMTRKLMHGVARKQEAIATAGRGHLVRGDQVDIKNMLQVGLEMLDISLCSTVRTRIGSSYTTSSTTK